MLTFWTLVVIFLIVVVGVTLSIYFAWRWQNGAMGLLAFLLICVACGLGTQIVHVAAQIDNIKLKQQ